MAGFPTERPFPTSVHRQDRYGQEHATGPLHKWLIASDYLVSFSEWNCRRSSAGRPSAPRKRAHHHVLPHPRRRFRPPLPAGIRRPSAGAVVLADRYIYTAFARDGARGVNPQWVRDLYSFAVRPTVAFYFRVPLEESLRRIISGRPVLKYYEAGLDLGLSDDPYESYRIFQGRILREYDRLVDEFGLHVVDAAIPSCTSRSWCAWQSRC